MYFAYGFPRALSLTNANQPSAPSIIYTSFSGSDTLVIVTTTSLQLWSGTQHRLKLGEYTRDTASLELDGLNTKAWWCPSRRVAAVATESGQIHFYGLSPSKELAWKYPDGQEIRKVTAYLQNSVNIYEVEGSVDGGEDERVADLVGDGRSLLVVLENGTMLVYSWNAQFKAASTLACFNPSTTSIVSLCYHSTSHLLAFTLSDGTAAVVSLPSYGVDALATVRSLALRWIYAPSNALRRAVSISIQSTGQYIAVGLAHGRVAMYSTILLMGSTPLSINVGGQDDNSEHNARINTNGRGRKTSGTALEERFASGVVVAAENLDIPSPVVDLSSSTPLQPINTPNPDRILSLTEWGYSSSMIGAAHVLEWSPDGRVLAAGYSKRGLAVWTPSGCRVMGSLRQAAQGLVGSHVPLHTTKEGGQGESALRKQASDLPITAGTFSSEELEYSLGTPNELKNPISKSSTAHTSAVHSRSASAQGTREGTEAGVLERGVSTLTWSQHGYSLVVGEVEIPQQLLEISFARSLTNDHRVCEGRSSVNSSQEMDPATSNTGGEELFVLQAADRLLLITSALPPGAIAAAQFGLLTPAEAEAALFSQPELALEHLRLPQQYIDTCWPLITAATAADGRDVAVAGSRGLAVYNYRGRKWRLFGDQMQERRVKVNTLSWLLHGVIAVIGTIDTNGLSGRDSTVLNAVFKGAGNKGVVAGNGTPLSALMLFPRHHLDFSSLLGGELLSQLPRAMDTVGDFVALAFEPLEITLVRVEYKTSSGAIHIPNSAVLVPVRELSIMSLGGPLMEMTLLAPDDKSHGEEKNSIEGDEPTHCVLLRGGGAFSVLDLKHGAESMLANEVETYWLPQSPGALPAIGIKATAPPLVGPDPITPLASTVIDDSAALLNTNSPAAKGAAWLERRSSDAAAAAAAMAEELQSLAATAAAMQEEGASPLAVATTLERTTSNLAAFEAGLEAEAKGLPVEMPWWTYGSRGMQLWFPSSLSDLSSVSSSSSSTNHHQTSDGKAFSQNNVTDPELEFDREVYPLGVSLAEVSIIGMMQRTARNATFPSSSPCALSLHPHPESQPVLPCLLRRLLEQGRAADALGLATRHSKGPHFARSLEWLLFTTLEADAESSSPHKHGARRVRFIEKEGAMEAIEENHGLGRTSSGMSDYSNTPTKTQKMNRQAGPLLIATARLIEQFPQAPEIIISVARKTDASLWPALFAAAGSPAALCDGMLRNGSLQSAACCLLIVDRVEGAEKAHGLALRLVRAALGGAFYELAVDLMRFLVPPGEGEAAGLGGGILGGALQSDRLDDAPIERNGNQGGVTSYASWLWSYFSGADKVTGPYTSIAGQSTNPASPSSVTAQLHKAASAVSLGGAASDSRDSLNPMNSPRGTSVNDFSTLSPAVNAWRAIGRHAWKLLDTGALRELSSLNTAMSTLHGGLPALLSTTAGEVPLTLGHTTPSAAAIASALFVASNEFSAAGGELAGIGNRENDTNRENVAARTMHAAEELRVACESAGCINHSIALALILGNKAPVREIKKEHGEVMRVLEDLVANDVHLCMFNGLLNEM